MANGKDVTRTRIGVSEGAGDVTSRKQAEEVLLKAGALEAGGLLSYAADLAEGYRTMKILKTLIQRADDGELLEADTIEYEGKLWIVPEWLAGPTKGTEMPARIICLDNLQTAKPGPRYWADLVLSVPLSKDFLEGRALMQGVAVIEKPDIFRRADTDSTETNDTAG